MKTKIFFGTILIFLSSCNSNEKAQEKIKKEIVMFDPNDPNTWSAEYKKTRDSIINESSKRIHNIYSERNERYQDTNEQLNQKIKESSFRNNILNSKAQPGSIIDFLQKLEKNGVSGFHPSTLYVIEENIIKMKKQCKNDKDAIAYLDNVLYKIKKGIESQKVPIPIKDTI